MGSRGKRWLLFISLLAMVGFVLNLYTSATFEAPPFLGAGNQSRPEAPAGPFEPFFRARLGLPLHSMFLASALLIAAVVPVSYYIVSESLEQNLEAKFSLISKLVKGGRMLKSGPAAEGKEIVLKFLNPSERKVVEALIRKKGEMLQAELSRLDGMDKLRTHRAIRDLERKGVVSVHARGKTNLIALSKDVRDLFG